MIQTQLWFNQGHYPPPSQRKKKEKVSAHKENIKNCKDRGCKRVEDE